MLIACLLSVSGERRTEVRRDISVTPISIYEKKRQGEEKNVSSSPSGKKERRYPPSPSSTNRGRDGGGGGGRVHPSRKLNNFLSNSGNTPGSGEKAGMKDKGLSM